MKKLMLSGLLITTIGIAVVGCKKENIKPVEKQNTLVYSQDQPMIDMPDIQQKDGMLVFETQEEFYNAINKFGSMSAQQRIDWGVQNDFKTQKIIFDEICIAENDFDRQYFEGIDEKATLEELENLNRPIKFSNEYNEYLSKGFINQVVSDSGYSFNLNVLNPLMSNVLNEWSKCLVNDTLYYYSNNLKCLIQKRYEGLSDVEYVDRITNLDSNEDYLIFNLESDRSNNYFFIDNIWSQYGTDNENDWTWYYNSSDERFRHYVLLNSTVDSWSGVLYVDYRTEAIAEYRGWFKWRVRSKYKPIHSIEGKWDYWYGMYGNGAIWNSLSQSGGLSSPFYNHPTNQTNELGNNMEPAGTFNLVDVNEAIHIENMKVRGVFAGGCCGYSTNYYHN